MAARLLLREGMSSTPPALLATALASTALLFGCATDGDAFLKGADEGFPVATSTPTRPTRAPSAAVTCRCDARGGLHVRAPHEATVRAVPAGDDAAAEIRFDEPDPRPIRTTKSLGFIGDGPLGQGPQRGRPAYEAQDALLPPHAHGASRWGYGRSSYGGTRWTPGWHTPPTRYR